jgi:hypothetical protein
MNEQPATAELENSTSAAHSSTGEEVFKRVCDHYDDLTGWRKKPVPDHAPWLADIPPTSETIFTIDESLVGFPFCKEDFKLQLTPEQVEAAIEFWRCKMIEAVNEVAQRYQNQVQKDNNETF